MSLPLFGLATVPQGFQSMRARVPMRDKVRLDTNIFIPSSTGRFPAVLVRTPYGKGDGPLPGYKLFLDHGYALVIQDVRGRYGSDGSFNSTAREGPDGYATIEWIARQPWSDGNVVMSGGSYLGMAEWQAALLGNPHLKAIFPVVSGCDEYLDRFYSPGGAIKLGHRLLWLSENFAAPGVPRPRFSEYIYHLPLRTSDRAATGRALDTYQKAIGHPAYDNFWKKLSVCGQIEKIHVPVFAAGGWYDNYVEGDLDAFSALSKLGKHPHLIVGPWPHNMSYKFSGVDFGPNSSAPVRRYQLQWYDRLVKPAVMAHFDDDAPLHIFVMGANRWRNEQEWPLARAHATPFYLASQGHANSVYGDGDLLREPDHTENADRYVYDPKRPVLTRGGSVCCDPKFFLWGPLDQRPVEQRHDVLVYTSPALKHDLEVTGPIKVLLWASTSARDTDFTAKLVDVFPDGESRNLTDGILRLRYRNGLARSVMAKPDEIYPLVIDAGVTSNVFLAAHRIRLEISSSNFPRFDRNPNTGGSIADETKLKAANQTVYHGRRYPSRIILPVVPPAATPLAHARGSVPNRGR